MSKTSDDYKLEESPVSTLLGEKAISPVETSKSGFYLLNKDSIVICNFEHQEGVVISQKTLKVTKKIELKHFEKKWSFFKEMLFPITLSDNNYLEMLNDFLRYMQVFRRVSDLRKFVEKEGVFQGMRNDFVQLSTSLITFRGKKYPIFTRTLNDNIRTEIEKFVVSLGEIRTVSRVFSSGTTNKTIYAGQPVRPVGKR